MRVINTRKGQVVSVEERYTGPERDAIEKVERMFDHMFGFGDLKKPTAEVVALVQEAAKQTAQIHHERHEQAEEAIAKYRDTFFLVRWFTKAPKPYADIPVEQVIGAYRAKFERFLRWLRDKNHSSRFYLDQLNDEIVACERLLRELK